MMLQSSYKDGDKMPDKYGNIGVVGGENFSPPFEWSDAPEGTKSFALYLVDHHPVANEFVHWVVINIPATVNSIKEGVSGSDKMPSGSKELSTTYGRPGYGGPRPPAETGDHPYETIVYALSEELDLPQDINPKEFPQLIQDKVLAQASLTGLFSQ